jgi:hypothetical protein
LAGDANLTDQALIDAMLAHPILMNRPGVVTPLGAKLCRPSERCWTSCPAATGAHWKEGGNRESERQGEHVAKTLSFRAAAAGRRFQTACRMGWRQPSWPTATHPAVVRVGAGAFLQPPGQ